MGGIIDAHDCMWDCMVFHQASSGVILTHWLPGVILAEYIRMIVRLSDNSALGPRDKGWWDAPFPRKMGFLPDMGNPPPERLRASDGTHQTTGGWDEGAGTGIEGR